MEGGREGDRERESFTILTCPNISIHDVKNWHEGGNCFVSEVINLSTS